MNRYPAPYRAPRYQPVHVDVIDLLALVFRGTQPLKGAACADPAVAHLFDDDAGDDAHGRATIICTEHCPVLERCRAYAAAAPAGTVSGVLGGTVDGVAATVVVVGGPACAVAGTTATRTRTDTRADITAATPDGPAAARIGAGSAFSTVDPTW